MPRWDSHALNQRFTAAAARAARAVRRCRVAARSKREFEKVHDQYIALLNLSSYLVGGPFLANRTLFLRELHSLLEGAPTAPIEAFDAHRFLLYRRELILRLIREFEVAK